MALSLFCFGPLHAGQATERSQSWMDVAEFLIQEEDRDGLLQLQEKVLKEKPSEIDLVSRLLDYHLRNKDRKMLRSTFERLNTELKCQSYVQANRHVRGSCEEYRRLWINNLDSVLFFADSAPQIEKSRRLISAKDCSAALDVLKKTEAREGAVRPVLVMMGQVYRCLGDVPGNARTMEQLSEIRIFGSASADG